MTSKLKSFLKSYWIYGVITAVLFFALPFAEYLLPQEQYPWLPFIVLATINPIALLVLSIIHTVKHGFTVFFHIGEALLFLASVAVVPFYGYGTLPYAIYYVIVTVIFSFVTAMLRRDS